MTGVGVDLVDVGRVQLYVEASPAFVEAAWTDREQEQCTGRPERWASRWAAKEAVMKALGVGLGRVRPDDIEILSDDEGKPAVLLHGKLRDAFPDALIMVSMSHEGPWAVAVAIATTKEQV